MSGKRRYFGTDGVRGVVGEELSPELVEGLGRAFALWSGGRSTLVGRDTRVSGPQLERALAGGLAAGGAAVLLAGVLPTPAVALLAEEAGAVVSASHNPAEYNGVKFFSGGRKLTDAEEEAVEGLLGERGPGGGEVREVGGLPERYRDLVCERFGRPLGGLHAVLDCANGALSGIAPEAFRRLGARVTAVAASGDGRLINEGCGATDLSLVSRVTRAQEADLGLAFDGDGDRLLAVDAAGCEVDGDQILAVLALHLGVDVVAVTAMTNLGFHRLMAERGVRVVTTDVGDRYVLEALRREGGILGGEQSGHVIYLNGHVSGDGLAAALLLCGALVQGAGTLAEAVAVMPRWPQAKASVRVRVKALPPALVERVEALNAQLDGRGRVLVRPSGTEPVVRVLAEAERQEEAASLCASMAALVERELG
jgi:phosphoglucosamine mutase